MTYVKPPVKSNPICFIFHVETNDLRTNQDPQTIERNVVEVINNSKTCTNKVLISTIVPRRDNLNGQCHQNIFLNNFCMENNFVCVNHDNIKPRQHYDYSGINLNTLDSNAFAVNFVLPQNSLT